MRKLILTAGVAALAIAAPAAAKPGGGHGGGQQAQQQRGGGQKAQRGGGNGGGQRQMMQVQRGGGGGGGGHAFAQQRGGGGGSRMTMQGHGGGRALESQRRSGQRQAQVQRTEHKGGNVQRFANFQTQQHGRGNGHAQQARVERGGQQRVQRAEDHGQGRGRMQVQDRAQERFAVNHNGRGNQRIEVQNRDFDQRVAANGREMRKQPDIRVADRAFSRRVLGDRYYDEGNFDRVHNTAIYVNRGLPAAFVGGCPPGLAKKSPACVPPGLAQTQFVGRALPGVYTSNYIPQSLRYMYYDTPDYYYRYGDGYVYRVNRTNNLVAALLPLIGAGYGIGQPFPYASNPYYYVPSYYQSFYPDTPYDYYRYDNGYVYQIDAGTGLIQDVVPLLDRGYGVGQMLPVSYSYYNVPYQYRSLYYDTPDYYYRYAPGAIYQVDAGTQMITSIASLLTGGLAVGQPLPPAYSVYNVPMAYRPTYYDTADNWYRYSDGYIYQVDPTTQLITAIVRAIV